MKKILTLALLGATLCASAAGVKKAEFENGYYRIGNNFTNRYIQVVDNRGSLNYSAASADMAAIRLRLGLENVISDPASVLYIEKHGDQYDVKAQNTGIHQIIGTYVNIMHNPANENTYWAYGTKGSITLYLYDYYGNGSKAESWLDTTNKTYPDARNWDITPIDNSTDNYFGVAPSIPYKDKYYQPFYAAFPFNCASEGMRVYYISVIDEERGELVYKEITGIVPPLTPVLIECSSPDPADNKLNIGGSGAAIEDNMLKGVLFELHLKGHDNYVAYNTSAMRSLGITADGELGGVKGQYTDVPRNTIYIPVSAAAPAEFKLISEHEYNGINDVIADAPTDFDVYTVTGIKVKTGTDSTEGLPSGFYIVNGKKVYVR